MFGLVLPSVKTGIALLNPPLNDPAEVDLHFFNPGGNEVAMRTINLLPGEKVARFLDELVSGLEGFTGSVEMRADEPISFLPIRQEGLVLTTQDAFPPRQQRN